MDKHSNIFELLDLPIGNLAIKHIDTISWGGAVDIHMIYRYPPNEKPFMLHFHGVRSIQWIVVKMDASSYEEAQLLTHDIGEGDYQRTARFATVLAEVIISYQSVDVTKDA